MKTNKTKDMGVAIGAATGNMGLWLSLGIALGIAIAGGINRKDMKK